MSDGAAEPYPAAQISDATSSSAAAIPLSSPNRSPRSNGFLVRLVTRSHIDDGTLVWLVTMILAIFLPPVFFGILLRNRLRRGPTTWFQMFGCGQPPKLPSSLLLPTATTTKRQHLRLVCISDTHMRHRGLTLPAGDVLVHCGDATCHGTLREFEEFGRWFNAQPHRFKVFVPGNHDLLLDEPYYAEYWSDWSKEKEDPRLARAALTPATVLQDASITIEGVKIYGSPYVLRPKPPASLSGFNREPEELRRLFGAIEPCDVLLTHSPPYGAGDRDMAGKHSDSSVELSDAVAALSRPPRFHVFGHVHTDWGVAERGLAGDGPTVQINAASVSDYYVLRRNAAIVFDVPIPRSEDTSPDHRQRT
jgi:hypothetical protein